MESTAATPARPGMAELHAAVDAFQKGQLAEAEQLCKSSLELNPGLADTWHLWATIERQRGRLADAEQHVRRAIAIGEHPMFLMTLYAIHRGAGRIPEAEAVIRRAAEIAPADAQVHYTHALFLIDRKRPAQAEQALRRAIDARAGFHLAHIKLTQLLLDRGAIREALDTAKRHAEEEPDCADAHSAYGALAWMQGDAVTAEAQAREALRLDPAHPGAHANLGVVHQGAGRWSEAEAEYRAALAGNPNEATALSNLGSVLIEQKRGAEAESLFRRAIELNPSLGAAHSNLGLRLQEVGRRDEAKASFLRALELSPDDPELLNNLGAAYQAEGRSTEALPLLERSVSLRPDYDLARMNLAFVHLSQGRFEEGWRLYESRLSRQFTSNRQDFPEMPYPRWEGQPLQGKSILIWPEQGFGDEIQFVRYAAALKERGAREVIVRCKPQLKDLIANTAGVDGVVTSRTEVPLCDYWNFGFSLPRHLGTTVDTIPARIPYIKAPDTRLARWRDRLPPGFKVGLVWKGAAKHGNDAQRSLAGLEMLAPLWRVPGVNFISLQKGQAEDQAASPPDGQPLIALGAEMEDFADAAAIVAQLDLVICVDTAMAHLAGALGRRTWVLLPKIGTDWRWLRDREDSPWYPGVMRLFRQEVAGAWEPVIARIAQELERLVRGGAQARSPDAILTTALAAHQAGRSQQAHDGYREVLALAPEHADAWHLLGLTQYSLGDAKQAETSIRRALAISENALFLRNLAQMLRVQGRRDEEQEALRRAIALNDAHARPELVKSLLATALAAHEAGRLQAAERDYREVLAIDERNADAWHLLGLLQFESGDRATGEQSVRRAMGLSPRTLFALNLARLLRRQDRLDEAEATLRDALERDPSDAALNRSLASLLRHGGNAEQAIEAFRLAHRADPTDPKTRAGYGMLLLQQGRFSEGWPLYESRHGWGERLDNVGALNALCPQWKGEPLLGRSLLVWPEQGFGDNIQFVRYLRLLKALGCERLSLAAPPHTRELLRSAEGIDEIVDPRATPSGFDYWTFPLSIPYHLRTTLETIPAELPYLSAPADRVAAWKERLPAGPKIGLVWRGSLTHDNDAARSLPSLALLAPLWKAAQATFVSLQKGAGEDEAQSAPAGQPLLALGSELRDFADTAAVIQSLDLVVTVDTSVAHVAGAVGKPVWVMLPAHGCDWRWLQGRDDSPWYPKVMRLFRQRAPGDWQPVVDEVARELSTFMPAPQ